jgi:MFS family permease
MTVTISARIPSESFLHQARTNTTLRSVNRAVMVLAAPLAGILADAWGIRSVFLLAAGIFALVAAGLGASSFRNVGAPA